MRILTCINGRGHAYIYIHRHAHIHIHKQRNPATIYWLSAARIFFEAPGGNPRTCNISVVYNLSTHLFANITRVCNTHLQILHATATQLWHRDAIKHSSEVRQIQGSKKLRLIIMKLVNIYISFSFSPHLISLFIDNLTFEIEYISMKYHSKYYLPQTEAARRDRQGAAMEQTRAWHPYPANYIVAYSRTTTRSHNIMHAIIPSNLDVISQQLKR